MSLGPWLFGLDLALTGLGAYNQGQSQRRAAQAQNEAQEKLNKAQFARDKEVWEMDYLNKLVGHAYKLAENEALRYTDDVARADYEKSQSAVIDAALQNLALNSEAIQDQYVTAEGIRYQDALRQLYYDVGSSGNVLQSQQLQNAINSANSSENRLSQGASSTQGMIRDISNSNQELIRSLGQSSLQKTESINTSNQEMIRSLNSSNQEMIRSINQNDQAMIRSINESEQQTISALAESSQQRIREMNVSAQQRDKAVGRSQKDFVVGSAESKQNMLTNMAISNNQRLRDSNASTQSYINDSNVSRLQSEDTINRAREARQLGGNIRALDSRLNDRIFGDRTNATLNNRDLEIAQQRLSGFSEKNDARQKFRTNITSNNLDAAQSNRSALNAVAQYMNSIKANNMRSQLLRQQKEAEGANIQENIALGEAIDSMTRDAEYIAAMGESATRKAIASARLGGSSTAAKASLDTMQKLGRSYGLMRAEQNRRRLEVSKYNASMTGETAKQLMMIANESAGIRKRIKGDKKINNLRNNKYQLAGANITESYELGKMTVNQSQGLNIYTAKQKASDEVRDLLNNQNQNTVKLAQEAATEQLETKQTVRTAKQRNALNQIGYKNTDNQNQINATNVDSLNKAQARTGNKLRQLSLGADNQFTQIDANNTDQLNQIAAKNIDGLAQTRAQNTNTLNKLNAQNTNALGNLSAQNINSLNATAAKNTNKLNKVSAISRHGINKVTGNNLNALNTIQAVNLNDLNQAGLSARNQIQQKGIKESEKLQGQKYDSDVTLQLETFNKSTIPGFGLAQRTGQRQANALYQNTFNTVNQQSTPYREATIIDPPEPIAGLKPELRDSGKTYVPSTGSILLNTFTSMAGQALSKARVKADGSTGFW